MKHPVAVIGAGNGGTAISAHLAGLGVDVNLCDLFPQYLEAILAAGGIELTNEGATAHRVLHMVTADVPAAIAAARLILVVTPSFAHRMVAKAVAPALRDGHIVVLNPGRTGGALEFWNTVREEGCRADITVAETQTLIYSCRRTGGAAVEIYGTKKEVDLGALPANRTQEVLDALHPYYPQFRPAKNCLQTGLSNIGALFHPAPVLLNAGRIENDARGFLYYWDGITPSVAKLIHRIDLERCAVAQAYCTPVVSAEEWLRRSYDTCGGDLYELIQHNDAYADIRAPRSIDARYLTEDVPMSLVPLSELARIAGVPVPNIDAVITLAGTLFGRDFRAQGRSAARLGIEGMRRDRVVRYFETGEK